jgi:hypothetical protein
MSAENTYLTHKQVCNLWGNLEKPAKIDNYIIIVHVFKFDVILLVEFEENNKRTKFGNQK